MKWSNFEGYLISLNSSIFPMNIGRSQLYSESQVGHLNNEVIFWSSILEKGQNQGALQIPILIFIEIEEWLPDLYRPCLSNYRAGNEQSPYWESPRIVASPDFVVQGQNVVVVKRHLTHDQREQGHSQRPDVRGLKQGAGLWLEPWSLTPSLLNVGLV